METTKYKQLKTPGKDEILIFSVSTPHQAMQLKATRLCENEHSLAPKETHLKTLKGTIVLYGFRTMISA